MLPPRLGIGQCYQMVRLFFNIWPFATMYISPKTSHICKSRLSILPKKKLAVKNSPKTCKLLPKCRNFPKSGHTGLSASKCLIFFIIAFFYASPQLLQLLPTAQLLWLKPGELSTQLIIRCCDLIGAEPKNSKRGQSQRSNGDSCFACPAGSWS